MSQETIIHAKTFTCHYIEKEDRILLTINYENIEERVDFWVTRSFLIKLLPYFFDYTTSKPQEESMEMILNTNSSNSTTFVLTQKTPVLLESMDFQPQENGDIKLVFKNLERSIFCVCYLDGILFNSFVTLLTKTAPKYEWGIENIN